MKIKDLLSDYDIPYDEGSTKNVQEGWIGIQCPFCDDTSNHLGYNVEEDKGFNCWKCGYHSPVDTIKELLSVSRRRAYSLIKAYGGQSISHEANKIVKVGLKAHNLPPSTGELGSLHKRYLKSRGFDPEKIANIWGVMGTGPFSKMDNTDYKHRLVIPIFWDGMRVSFQTRDVTGKAGIKYITCPEEREIIHHKNIVYGLQEYLGDTGIVTEGVTDVWRLGTNSCATFGINYTLKQVRVISKIFKKVFIIFDNDKKARKQAEKLEAELKFRGTDAINITIEDDPGSLSQEEADNLVKELI